MTKRTLSSLFIVAVMAGCTSTAPSDYELNKQMGLPFPGDAGKYPPPTTIVPGAPLAKTPDKIVIAWRYPEFRETYVTEGSWMHIEVADGDWVSK